MPGYRRPITSGAWRLSGERGSIPVMDIAAPLRLASGPPSRARILRDAGVAFEIEHSRVDEGAPLLKAAPDEQAALLAATKAADVAARHPGELILGADTVVVLNDRVLGKPGGASDGGA